MVHFYFLLQEDAQPTTICALMMYKDVSIVIYLGLFVNDLFHFLSKYFAFLILTIFPAALGYKFRRPHISNLKAFQDRAAPLILQY